MGGGARPGCQVGQEARPVASSLVPPAFSMFSIGMDRSSSPTHCRSGLARIFDSRRAVGEAEEKWENGKMWMGVRRRSNSRVAASLF